MALTAEQLEQRRETLGSSEIAAIVGEDSDQTPLDVWLSKHGEPGRSTLQTELGEILEEPLARYAARLLGAVAFDKAGTFTHGIYPWVTATPDFLISLAEIAEARRVLELKNVGWRMAHRWGAPELGQEAVPYKVQLQCQWQLEVTDIPQAHVGALIGGRDFLLAPVPRDKALAADLLTVANDWWRRHIINGRTPDADGTERYRDFIRRRFAVSNGRTVEADESTEDLMQRWRYAAGRRKHFEEEEERAKQAVALRVGDAARVLGDCGTLTRVDVRATHVEYDKAASWHWLPRWKEAP